jgi:RsiW-degrading membrane proteinase PrsW (M82 family)
MLLTHIITVLIWHGLIFIILAKEGLALRSLLLSFVAGSLMFILVMAIPLLQTFIISVPVNIISHHHWQAFISSALSEELVRAFVILLFIKGVLPKLKTKEKLLMTIAIGTVFATIENSGYASSSSLSALVIRLLVITPLHMSLSALHLIPKRGFFYAWLAHGIFNSFVEQSSPWVQIVQVTAGISLIPLYFTVKMHDRPEEKFTIWE